jgi:hypothetical protein
LPGLPGSGQSNAEAKYKSELSDIQRAKFQFEHVSEVKTVVGSSASLAVFPSKKKHCADSQTKLAHDKSLLVLDSITY